MISFDYEGNIISQQKQSNSFWAVVTHLRRNIITPPALEITLSIIIINKFYGKL